MLGETGVKGGAEWVSGCPAPELLPVEMLVPGHQEQGCVQGLPLAAWDVTAAAEPKAQAERPNSQQYKIPPWKLFGCWSPGLFLAALGRSVFLLLCSRAEMNKELSSLSPRGQPRCPGSANMRRVPSPCSPDQG